MRQYTSTRVNQFHRFPPTGLEGRNLDGVCDNGSPPWSHRHETTGPTSASSWVKSPLFSPKDPPAIACTHSMNPAPAVLAEIFVAAPPSGSPSQGDSSPATPRPPCHSLSPCSTQHSERGVAFHLPGGPLDHSLPRSRCSPPHNASLRADFAPGRSGRVRFYGQDHRPGHPRFSRCRAE